MKYLFLLLVVIFSVIVSNTSLAQIGEELELIENADIQAVRQDEVIELTNFITQEGKPAYSIKSLNMINGKIYYKLVSYGGRVVYEDNPDFVDSSLYYDDDLFFKTTHEVGKLDRYPDQANEFQSFECPDSNIISGWSNRAYNKITGETYYTVISIHGRTRIIYPLNQKFCLENKFPQTVGSRLSLPRYPAGDLLKLGYISDDKSTINVSLFSSTVYTDFKYKKYDVKSGYNLLNIDLKDVLSGNYLLRIDDGFNAYSTMIVVKK